MSKSYETTDRRLRANQKRQDALECERAGFRELARINWEEAALLDPPKEDEEIENSR